MPIKIYLPFSLFIILFQFQDQRILSNKKLIVTDTILPKINLISNGDFEQGNAGFTSEYEYVKDTIWHGHYTITKNISEQNKNLFPPAGGDHTSGKGNYMVVDSKIFRKKLRSQVWCSENVKVEKNTTYAFSAWLYKVGGGGSRSPELEVTVNGKAMGTVFKIPPYTNHWNQMYYTWNSEENTEVNLCIESIYVYQYMEDFGIDDIVFGKI